MKETMALEVVTDRKHDKTEKDDNEYVYNKRTRDGTCAVSYTHLTLPTRSLV